MSHSHSEFYFQNIIFEWAKMPVDSSLKASDSHNTLKSSILPGGFSALSLKPDATRHSFHHKTQYLHSQATAATLHHSQTINPESDTWMFLGSMPAIQRYKGRLCGIKTQEITHPFESCLYRYHGDPRTRWQNPPQRLLRSWIWLRENVGLDASYAVV